LPAALTAFVAASLPFVSLGQALAQRMDEHPRTVAYGWDIAGSLAGHVGLHGVFVSRRAALGLGHGDHGRLGLPLRAWVARGCPCCRSGPPSRCSATRRTRRSWSPYYFIQHAREPIGLRVWVNSSFHQLAIDFTDKGDPQTQIADAGQVGVPYGATGPSHGGATPRRCWCSGGDGERRGHRPRERRRSVVAVEIDPVILKLGRDLNPSAPYADPGCTPSSTTPGTTSDSSPERFD
jgi:hypothetical protein